MRKYDQLWRKSKVPPILNIFSQEVKRYFHTITPQSLEYAMTYSPFIFWRWYFLILEHAHATPYMEIEFYRQIEKWPEDGQFFPQAHIQYSSGKIDLNVTTDYITFGEQPLIVEVINKQKGHKPEFSFGEIYEKHIRDLAVEFRQDNPDPFAILRFYKTYLLTDWYNEFDVVGQAFGSFSAWEKFWKDKWYIMTQRQYYDTSFLLDSYILHMRKTFPDFGLLNIEQYGGIKEDRKGNETYDFWNSLNMYMVVPFSLFSNLLAPTFKTREFYFQDLAQLLQGTMSAPFPFFSPCTFLSLTSFGQMAIDAMWE